MFVLLLSALLSAQATAPTKVDQYRAICTELAEKQQLKVGLSVEQCAQQLAAAQNSEELDGAQNNRGQLHQVSSTSDPSKEPTQGVFGIWWLLLAIFVGYWFSGGLHVMQDFAVDFYERPVWTYSPTVGKVLQRALWWPEKHVILLNQSRYPSRPDARVVLGGLISAVVGSWIPNTLWIWFLLAVSGLVSVHPVARSAIALGAFVITFGLGVYAIYFPIASKLLVPLTLILSSMVNALLPRRVQNPQI